MKHSGAIPLEQGVVKEKTTTNNSLLKQLFFDQANILDKDCALSITDAKNWYNAVIMQQGALPCKLWEYTSILYDAIFAVSKP